MADILRFPKHSAEKGGEEFLQDDEILDFEFDVAKGVAGVSPIKSSASSLLKNFSNSDWSNQELATLFRVKRLLDAAGVRSDIDRGITDEGDPWFVFCDPQGEVFIHLCRINGTYLLDSPNVAAPLVGRDFNELIVSFTQQKLLNRDDQPNLANHRLVRLKGDGKVFMHPSTMLAALIWTVFLASEEIVMLIPEDSDDAMRLVDETDSVSHAPPTPEGAGGGSLEKDHKIFHDSGIIGVDRDSIDDTKFGQNSYAIGLTAIAASLGFLSDTLFADDATQDSAGLLAEADKGTDVADSSNTSTDGDKIDFLAALGELIGDVATFDFTTQVEPPDQTGSMAADTGSAKASQTGFELFNTVYQDTKAHFEDVLDQASAGFAAMSLSKIADISAENVLNHLSAMATEPSMGDVDQIDAVLAYVSQIDDAKYLVKDLDNYVINDISVKATFDISSEELQRALELAEASHSETIDGSVLSDSGTYSVYDTAVISTETLIGQDEIAMEYIEYAFSQGIDLELIALDDELVFVDRTVLEGGQTDMDTVTYSWTMSNGDTVSLIGLQSDFAELDMIA